MRRIISISAGAMSRTTEIEDCLSILQHSGYETIDFWLSRYSGVDTMPMRQPDWRGWIMRLRGILADRGMKVGQIHALWDFPEQIAEDFSLTLPGQVFHDSIEATRMLNCSKLVFHPIERFFLLKNEEERKQVLDINVEWFGSLLPDAHQFGVELHIENLFDYKHIQPDGSVAWPGSCPEDILYILDQIGDPLMKTCLDTGHANISGVDIPTAIRMYGSKLGSLHLNDNYGKIRPIYEDLHLFPGYGAIDWKHVFKALDEIGYAGTLNMEPNTGLSKQPYEFRIIRLKAAGELLRTMESTYCGV